MVTGIRRLVAASLCLALLLPMAGLGETEAAVVDRTVIFSEDFEHAWPGVQPHGWDRWDLDDGSGIDHWCRSMFEAVSPTHAAWCAQIGYNSLFQNAMNKNVTRLEGSSTTYLPQDYVLRYDNNMDAYMRRPLIGIDSFASVTLTFRYWAVTGDSTTSIGDDHLWVSVTSSNETMPAANDRREIWRQPAENSSGWSTVTLPIPADSTWISFNFRSGPGVPKGGPFIGAFLDDIVVEGAGDRPPVSKAGPLPAAINGPTLDVPVSIIERGGGLSYIELYYRANGSGDFQLYRSAEAPTGRWVKGPVPFRAPADGRYELFSRAADIWGNLEALKTIADGTVIVDRGPPSSMATVSGLWGNFGWYISPVRIDLTGRDEASGIRALSYRLDGGEWNGYTGQITIGSEGRHLLEYFASDLAGNDEIVRYTQFKIDLSGPRVVLSVAEGGVFSSGDLAIRYDVIDALSGAGLVDHSVDGSAFRPLSLNTREIILTGLGNGPHQVVLRAWDNAGNPTEVTLNVSVDPSAVSSDLGATIAPLAMTALTLLGLTAVILFARRRG